MKQSLVLLNQFGYPVQVLITRDQHSRIIAIQEYYDGGYYSVARHLRDIYISQL